MWTVYRESDSIRRNLDYWEEAFLADPFTIYFVQTSKDDFNISKYLTKYINIIHIIVDIFIYYQT